MKFNQCLLESNKEQIVAFLESGKYNKGFFVTLKDSEDSTRRWKILEIYQPPVEQKDIKDSHESKNWYKKDWLHKMTPKN